MTTTHFHGISEKKKRRRDICITGTTTSYVPLFLSFFLLSLYFSFISLYIYFSA